MQIWCIEGRQAGKNLASGKRALHAPSVFSFYSAFASHPSLSLDLPRHCLTAKEIPYLNRENPCRKKNTVRVADCGRPATRGRFKKCKHLFVS